MSEPETDEQRRAREEQERKNREGDVRADVEVANIIRQVLIYPIIYGTLGI